MVRRCTYCQNVRIVLSVHAGLNLKIPHMYTLKLEIMVEVQESTTSIDWRCAEEVESMN